VRGGECRASARAGDAPGSEASRLAVKSVLRSFSANSAARCRASAWMLSTVRAFMSLVASRFAAWAATNPTAPLRPSVPWTACTEASLLYVNVPHALAPTRKGLGSQWACLPAAHRGAEWDSHAGCRLVSLWVERTVQCPSHAVASAACRARFVVALRWGTTTRNPLSYPKPLTCVGSPSAHLTLEICAW
jgi:hypothetical protein